MNTPFPIFFEGGALVGDPFFHRTPRFNQSTLPGSKPRSPSSALLPFFGGGFPIDCRKKGYPYCNLSTGDLKAPWAPWTNGCGSSIAILVNGNKHFSHILRSHVRLCNLSQTQTHLPIANIYIYIHMPIYIYIHLSLYMPIPSHFDLWLPFLLGRHH